MTVMFCPDIVYEFPVEYSTILYVSVTEVNEVVVLVIVPLVKVGTELAPAGSPTAKRITNNSFISQRLTG